jgi:hypothetical protein
MHWQVDRLLNSIQKQPLTNYHDPGPFHSCAKGAVSLNLPRNEAGSRLTFD